MINCSSLKSISLKKYASSKIVQILIFFEFLKNTQLVNKIKKYSYFKNIQILENVKVNNRK
jgi:hypothetical protein